MVKCKDCGHDNDLNASYCENCGKKINGFSNGNYDDEKTETGFSNLTKVLIAVCIVLIVGVGITAGYLIKNNQQPPAVAVNGSNTNSSGTPVSKADGFPVSEAPNLGYQIMKNNGTISSVAYNGLTLDKNQCLYILAKAVVMLNAGQTGNIPINSYGSAANPAGTVTSATIIKSDYVNIASRTVSWMDNYKNAPNYVGITNPGQPDLSPDTTLNMFAKVLSDYKATGQLPPSVSIP
ncbi:MAG: pseudomurein-binding repeat-containing protein [Methanobacterium sp. ERen5]|nr:MAG: pseudomurein-binding repeat-containing protein [Methanobacterium sp. ERen5]